jgi:hypothetical protein
VCDQCVPQRVNRDGTVAEVAPTHCPNGHRFGPRRVLVNGLRCGCWLGHNHHRTYTCETCQVTMFFPPHGAQRYEKLQMGDALRALGAP